MNLNKRYKVKGKRRIIKFICFYSFLASILIFYSTLAKYITISESTVATEVANWNIQVNEINITEQMQVVSKVITLIPDNEKQTTTNHKLAPGHQGHFDITINPEGTDVSLEYALMFNTENLPEGISFINYEVLKEGSIQQLKNNAIEGEINLTNNTESLNQNDSKTIRVYWKWEDKTINIPTGNEKYSIAATISIKQKLS